MPTAHGEHFGRTGRPAGGCLGKLGDLDIDAAIYFVSEITLVRGDDPGLRPWRERLFLLLARTSKSPVDSYRLPEHRIVTMGSYIEG